MNKNCFQICAMFFSEIIKTCMLNKLEVVFELHAVLNLIVTKNPKF